MNPGPTGVVLNGAARSAILNESLSLRNSFIQCKGPHIGENEAR